MKQPRLRQNAHVGDYRIAEFVGEEEGHSLYTATKSDPNETFWLLESSQSLDQLGSAQAEAFEVRSNHYLAFPVEGTSTATLARLIRAVDWKFIVPRWAKLSAQVGIVHVRGQLFQQASPLDLNTILFHKQAELLPLSYSKPSATATVFQAPELARGAASPASDVFALGAALSYLLGERSTTVTSLKDFQPQKKSNVFPELTRILGQATNPDPLKRFRDAHELADRLAAISPGASSLRPKSSPLASKRMLLVLLLLTLACAIAALGLLFTQRSALLVDLLRTLTPTPTVAPTTVPSGVLALEVVNMNFTSDRMGHIEIRFTRGGQPISSDLPGEFGVEFNGSPIARVTVEKLTSGAGDAAQYRYRLNFDASSLSNVTGTYLVTARMIGATLSRSIYFEQKSNALNESQNEVGESNTTSLPVSGGLSNLKITGLQLDSQHYPGLTLYFTVSGSDGKAVRLQGPVTVQVEQDGLVVTEVAMTSNDPIANPISVALAMDVSGSMHGAPNLNARQAATAFIGELGEGDAACVYSFSTVITPVEKCTTNRQAAENSMRTLGAYGNTALYEALVTIANDLNRLNGRKAIVLLSDGADTASHIGEEVALAQLKQTNIPIYAIGLASYQYRPAVLRDLVNATGGSFIEAPASANLNAFYALINAQLKNQYRIVFNSVFPDRKSGTLTIRLIQDNSSIETTYPFFVAK